MIERDLGFATLDRASSEWFVPLRKTLGLESFGINLLVIQPGKRGRVHLHERQEEVYVVLEGELTVQLEAEAYRLGPDDVMRVGPAVRRQLLNAGEEPAVVLAFGGSGTHESRDALAWTTWDEEGPGRSPREVPLPE
jgi:uncharacterized cupin superfamily protein